MKNISYGRAINLAFEHLMKLDKNVFLIGQGLWSPWYVGETMKELDLKFGKTRVIDSPVSENAITGIALGASLTKSRPVVIHPRMDFMILALDQIVNQAAKWHSMMGGKSFSNLTIRSIINRGGEQGAQHSQSLHSWLSHIPGLEVVMPSTVQDAYDLLFLAVRSNNPTVYIDDRWLYGETSNLKINTKLKNLSKIKPKKLISGNDLTIVGCGYGTKMAKQISLKLKKKNITCDVIDLRILNPLKLDLVLKSVTKTKKLIVIDAAWKSCSISSEVVASLNDKKIFNFKSLRINLFNSPAPTSKNLEKFFYINEKETYNKVIKFFNNNAIK